MVVRTGLGPELRERVELSDVVQEALVEVVRQFPQFTGQNEAALVGWLRRLVGQKLADLGRYHSRAKRSARRLGRAAGRPLGCRCAAEAAAGAGGRLLDMLALSQTSPSEAASRRELIVLLADALADLPEAEAEVLWLYHAEGLSFEAIGDRLGLSRKAIRGIWARGPQEPEATLEGPLERFSLRRPVPERRRREVDSTWPDRHGSSARRGTVRMAHETDDPTHRDRPDRPRRAAGRGDRGLPGAGRGRAGARPRGVRGRLSRPGRRPARGRCEGLALVQGLVGDAGRARAAAAGGRAGGSPATGSSASWAGAAWGSSTRRSTSASTARWR